MQNIDSGENNDTLNKFENLQLTQPISLESLSCQQHHSSRAIHSDPEETQAKTKTRSRFSSALKKLSRSTRKKDKPITATPSSTATDSTEPIVSSGTEDLPEYNLLYESEQTPKKKKKSAKTLFGLKKSKVAPKQKEEVKVEEETSRLLEPIFHDTENEVVVTTERLTPLDSRRKVQITIKSKKIETVASQEQLRVNPSTSPLSSSPPTPPPTPSAAVSATTATTTTTTTEESKVIPVATLTKVDEPVDNKKKLKTKVTTQTPQKSTTPTTAQSKSKQQQQQDEPEQIVITHCSKDTPPKERAPTKPSRLTATPTSQTSASSGAVRKTATTTRAAIKLVTGAKLKTKSSKSTKESAASTSSISKAATTKDSKKETDLMINPQRGHRLPRPASTTKNSAAKEPQSLTIETTRESQATDDTTTKSLPIQQTQQQQQEQQQQQHEQRIETITSPDCLSTTLPQTSSAEIRSSSTNASLQTPTKSNNDQTSAAIIDKQQQENIQTSPVDNSVQSNTFPQTDDHISLAESCKPSEYSEDTQQYDSSETIKEPVSVHFAVGSPVRPPPTQKPLYEFIVQEPSINSQKEDCNSDSSQLSENNLRRIHYITQPTLYDEFNSLELKRAHYRHQSGVSDLSLDSAENEYPLDDDVQQMPAFGDLTMDQDMEPTIMTTTNTEKREHLYKILVIGELGTGKTSFIKRYVHQFFSQNYRATIGVDFALKVLHWDPNTIIRLQLWDIAGQERFGNMTRVYYKEAVGAFIVFDVTRSGTFDCVSKWKEDLDSKVQLPDGSPIPCILLANKCDQDKQGVVTNIEKMDEYVKEHGFAGWFETSAKENINIDEAARALVNKILLNDKLISAADLADSEKFNLNNSGDQTAMDGKSKCSC